MFRLPFLRGVVLSAGVILASVILFSVPVSAETLDELKEELSSRKDTLKQAEARIQKFKEELQIKKREARTLQDQIEIIEDTIEQLRLSIDQTVAEIEATEAEISALTKEIEIKEGEIDHQKEVLAEYLRLIYKLKQQSSVTIFLKYATFSEALNESATVEDLQQRAHEALLIVRQLKEELEEERTHLEDFRVALEEQQVRQQQQETTLLANQQSKETVLQLTREQEAQFATLLEAAQQAHQEAESEISRLDDLIREELKKQGVGKLPSVGHFDWPVTPIFGISCPFHCAGYPYAYLIGPHSGIDVPTYVGTPIKAPADGYVAKVRNANGPGYSYILLLHGDNISTVYGHVSGFAVSAGQMVSRGTVIGYTGGAPGTNGAGLSSGPHLHFEARLNNIPVDPQQYL